MKKVILVATILLIAAALYLLFFPISTKKLPSPPLSSSSPKEEKVNYTAFFTIITDNITRSFKAEKYHNKSSDVYITADDPTQVIVKKKGITWDDFFKTLPMKLTKECLITGDGETLCDGQGGSLKFFLNDLEDKNLLDKEIKQNDQILVKFTPK